MKIVVGFLIFLSSGCTPPCVAFCERIKPDLVDNFGVSEEEACDLESIRNAQGCDACGQAIVDAYAVRPSYDMCSCPEFGGFGECDG